MLKNILPEYRDAPHLLAKNKTYHIRIFVQNDTTSLWLNDACYFNYTDTAAVTSGYFGFRSTWSRQGIKNFKVMQLL